MSIEYQVTQRGGIVYLSNSFIGCGSNPLTSGGTCQTAVNQMPPSSIGAYNNNNFPSGVPIDIDGDPTTVMSSSDSLSLPACSEISFAGLYWMSYSSILNPLNDSVAKFKFDNGVYQIIKADTVSIVNFGPPNTVLYSCFKNLTTEFQTAGINTRFTFADAKYIPNPGLTNDAGGWTVIIVYKNNFEKTRHLTVFDGWASITAALPILDVPVTGFQTQSTGNFDVEFGMVTFDGDRGAIGDGAEIKGQGSATFTPLFDAIHDANNVFNSTISNNGVLTPFRIPSLNNTLGHDASIFRPNNSTFQYLANNTSSLTVRVNTGGENYNIYAMSTVIDAFEPKGFISLSYRDVNGGAVNAGDIIEYKIKTFNMGEDQSANTYVVDTINPKLNYIPNSTKITFGSNLGPKTDVLADDQVDYNAISKQLKIRIGAGANAFIGGLINASPTGADSTIITYSVTVSNNCIELHCDSVVRSEAFLYETGAISTHTFVSSSSQSYPSLIPGICSLNSNQTILVATASCLLPSAINTSPICEGGNFNLDVNNLHPAILFNWTGPNAFTSSIQNPSFISTSTVTSGTYTLIVSSPGVACTYSSVTTATVNPLPVVNYSYTPACLNMPTDFTDLSTVSSGTINTWAWDFNNDGIVDNSTQNPSFSYTSFGASIATLTVTTLATCTNTISLPIVINANPVPNFSVVNTCINTQPNVFDATASVISVGTNTAYAWAFGDGSNASGVNVNHSYGLPTVYNVSLSVTSDRGCVTTISKPIEIYPKPSVSINNSVSCFNKITNFSVTTLPGSGSVTSWNWDFNSFIATIEATGQTTNFVFPAAGSQTIALITETNFGCRDTIKKVLYVDYVPSPLFTVDNPAGCPSHCVTFTDFTLPIPAPGFNADWKWVFGDGSEIHSSSGNPQAHCYNNLSSSALQSYDVKLVVTTSRGCKDSLIKNNYITVYPKPNADFDVNPNPTNVLTPLVNFTNLSTDFNKWWWSFGDGSNRDSINLNPTHFYNGDNAGYYTSALVVQNSYGCLDTAIRVIEVQPEFTFYIPNSFTPENGDGINDVFTGMGIGIEKYEMWIFDRWGAMIYYTDDIRKGWNGKVQGKPNEVKIDVYVWKVNLVDVFAKKHNYIGHVTVIR